MPLAAAIGFATASLSLCGSLYMLAAGPVTRRFFARTLAEPENFPPVTIFKPLHGAHANLYEDLASFVEQNYPAAIQFVFGVHGVDDDAIAVVTELRECYPAADVTLVIESTAHGTNPKISNLMNMAPWAKHSVFVLSDSDINVRPDFLKNVAGALQPPGTGAVTVCYAGWTEGGGIWARMAALDIDTRFLPNAAMGISLGLAHPCFGSAIALTRETYDRIGGFATFKDVLADDYELGRAVRGLGLTVSVPPMLVEHDFHEARLAEVWAHELRWARTIRTVDPLGHLGSALTHPLPWALLAYFCLGFNLFVSGLVVAALLSRMALKWHIDRIIARSSGPLWLLPLRDLMSFGVYLGSLFGRSVQWQDLRLHVEREGTLSGS